MEGLTLAKTTCDDFISFLSDYKIICLLETWTKKSSKIEIEGYKTLTHSYRKLVNRRAKRAGGGVIIYVKEEIHKGVKLINNELDCIVWLKLDRYIFGLNEDIYLGVTYIVPENSPIHAVYDIDLFDRLEEDIMLYSTKGSVFVTGDLNSRSGVKPDYVNNAFGRTDDDLNIVEIPMCRASKDKTVNRFGDRLLDLCKATGLCIVNGRLYGDANNGAYTCIYVKEEIHKGVKLINNELDCIVWLKLDRYIFGLNEDIYLGVTYIVPENSPIHAVYDIDLFDRLEEDIMLYSTKGSVFVTGDLNSRSGVKPDYVNNAFGRTDDDLNIVEIPMCRASKDKTVNRFGDRLLDLCKATGLCIVNGRLYGDANNGAYTCMTANGESLIDYLLTAYANFDLLTHFEVLQFNEYSNHSPLTFTVKTFENGVRETTREWQSFLWTDEHKDIFRNRLFDNMSTFVEDISNLDINTCTQECINELTGQFTNHINSAAGNLLKKTLTNPVRNRDLAKCQNQDKIGLFGMIMTARQKNPY